MYYTRSVVGTYLSIYTCSRAYVMSQSLRAIIIGVSVSMDINIYKCVLYARNQFV